MTAGPHTGSQAAPSTRGPSPAPTRPATTPASSTAPAGVPVAARPAAPPSATSAAGSGSVSFTASTASTASTVSDVSAVFAVSTPSVPSVSSAASSPPAGVAAPASVHDLAPRHRAGDPVKALVHLHHDLCARAVDPLEVAAGLEAAGITGRMAARFRHRDVFSLAEELYARVPRDVEDETAARERCAPVGAGGRFAVGARAVRAHAGWIAAALLPCVVCVLTLVGLSRTAGWARLAAAAGGVLAMVVALGAALCRGPLHTRHGDARGRRGHRARHAARVWTCVLVGYALLGDGLLRRVLPRRPGTRASGDGFDAPRAFRVFRGAPHTLRALARSAAAAATHVLGHGHGHGHMLGGALGHLLTGTGAPLPLTASVAAVLALSLAVLPAECCVRLFAAGAGRRVARSRDLAEFSALARPLLYGSVALYLSLLVPLLTLTAALLHQHAAYAGAGALGMLLMTGRLLMVHGFFRAPALLLGAAGCVEMLALASVFAARLPGWSPLAVPVRDAALAMGPGVVPGAACGAAACALLAYAARTLTRACVHAPALPAPGPA